MVTHMKTTIDMADDVLLRAKARARERKTTLRAVIEQALAASLDEPSPTAEIVPVTFRGNGLRREFDGAGWEKIRDAIYS